MAQVNTACHARQHKVAPAIPNQPQDNPPAVCFLLSDRAAGITGQVLRIDGQNICRMTHPAMRLPARTVVVGSVAAVADAFDQGLRGALAPLGLVSVQAPGPSAT